MSYRVIAIDWSGAVSGAARKIWLAEVQDGRVVRLESGRDRQQIAEHLIEEAGDDAAFVVGFDFAFSLPAWFIQSRGLGDGPALWELVEREGEHWLRSCARPFWGRAPGLKRPDLEAHFRRTDLEVPAVGGIRPKSVFQIGGAGAVGTGSLRGMPVLRQLRDAGFSVWPFDSVRLPLVVEIYPRALTGVVRKDSPAARDAYLRSRYPELPSDILASAAASDDAFDALVSALVMWEHRETLMSPPGAPWPEHLLEGRIWLPRGDSPSDRDPGTRIEAITATAARVVSARPIVSRPDAQRPDSGPTVCPFCARISGFDIEPSSHSAVALPDGFPLSPGHTLVVSREHERDFLRLPAATRDAMWRLVDEVCERLRGTHSPDGFNLGVNVGDAAGQTVPHAHIHVIPRYGGDVEDPRGGVRWVLPAKARYW